MVIKKYPTKPMIKKIAATTNKNILTILCFLGSIAANVSAAIMIEMMINAMKKLEYSPIIFSFYEYKEFNEGFTKLIFQEPGTCFHYSPFQEFRRGGEAAAPKLLK